MEELLGTLDRDPWGRPYRMVRKRFRGQAPPLMESLHPEVLSRVVATLLPDPPELLPPPMSNGGFVAEEPVSPHLLTDTEMGLVTERLRNKRRAPGPDGVPGQVLGVALGHLGGGLRELFDRCLSVGRFPKLWKVGLYIGRPLHP